MRYKHDVHLFNSLLVNNYSTFTRSCKTPMYYHLLSKRYGIYTTVIVRTLNAKSTIPVVNLFTCRV